MHKIALLGLLALGTCLAGAGDAQAWGLPPVKVNLTFRVDVRSDHTPPPQYPWWTYFPYDPHLMAPASGPTYPNWPQQQAGMRPTSMPLPAAPTPNVTQQYRAPAPVQPVAYQPGFAFDR